jgi:hypothetical protein
MVTASYAMLEIEGPPIPGISKDTRNLQGHAMILIIVVATKSIQGL